MITTGEIDVGGTSDVLTPVERQYYIDTFMNTEGGVEAATRYYKSTRFRYDQEQELKVKSHLPAELPVFFVAPMQEPFTTLERIEKSLQYVPSQETMYITDSGHFPMFEKSGVFERIIGEWVEGQLRLEASR